MEKHSIKQCSNLLNKLFCVIKFSRISDRICISLNNEPRQTRPTLIDLNSNEIHYYLFIVSLERYNGNYKFKFH